MASKSVLPSIEEVAFDCPHCGAYTTHTWFDLFAQPLRKEDRRSPGMIDPQVLEAIDKLKDIDAEQKARFKVYFGKILRGLVVIDADKTATSVYNTVGNLHLSRCFNCSEVAVWLHERVIFPTSAGGPPPNEDMPEAVQDDYEEASRTLAVSPRGAAALLRLSIQKLCKELGEKGKNIDDDVAAMVKKGLSPVVQQALDTVRVIGNEAVHPGTLDLKDDTETATKLFGLVNIICEQMISNPKHVKALYEKLPAAKRAAIDKRDSMP